MSGIVAFHRLASTLINSTSLALNAVLIRLVLRHSRFERKDFKSLFLLTCVGGFALSAVLLFVQPVGTCRTSVKNVAKE